MNIVQSQTLIADCYRKQKLYQKAIAVYEELLADPRFKDDSTTCQKLHAQIGYCEEEAGNLDAAKEARALSSSHSKDTVANAKKLRLQKDYAGALKILLPLHQNSNRIDILLEVLYCYCDKREYPQALAHLDTFRRQHTVNAFDMFKLKMFEVRLFEDIGDLKQMLERCNEAEALCNKPETLALKAEVLEKRMRCLTEMAERPEFSAQLTGALTQISTTGFGQKTLLPFLQRFATAKQAEDKGDKTSTILLEKLAQECKQELRTQTTMVARNSSTTAVVPVMAFDPDGSMNDVVYCFYKSYLALAINYEKIGRLADAQHLYQELLATPTVTSNSRVVITILIARARCFEKAQDASNAHMCLNKAFTALSQQNVNNNNSIQELFEIQLTQARLHQRFGEYTQALFIFDQLLENPEIVKNKEMYRLILLGRARVFEEKNNTLLH